MAAKERLKHIAVELKSHAPFTTFGALFGIVFMIIFEKSGLSSSRTLFSIFHPAHVILSAMATAAIFRFHKKQANFFVVLIVGYFGSIGIATLSDSVIPYIGENLLGAHIPAHSEFHKNPNQNHQHVDTHTELDEESHIDIHLGFIEQWYIVNPAALLGVLIAYFLPRTKFPHAAHVLISTWASSAHILMNSQGPTTFAIACGLFMVLFIAVWVPCCISDIVFPLLFVKSDLKSFHLH